MCEWFGYIWYGSSIGWNVYINEYFVRRRQIAERLELLRFVPVAIGCCVRICSRFQSKSIQFFFCVAFFMCSCFYPICLVVKAVRSNCYSIVFFALFLYNRKLKHHNIIPNRFLSRLNQSICYFHFHSIHHIVRFNLIPFLDFSLSCCVILFLVRIAVQPKKNSPEKSRI